MAEGVRDINKLAVIKKEAPQLADQIQKLYAGISTIAQGGHPAFLTDAQIATLSAEMDTFQAGIASLTDQYIKLTGRTEESETEMESETKKETESETKPTESETAATEKPDPKPQPDTKRERDKTAGTVYRDTGKSKTGEGKRSFRQGSFERETGSEMEKSQKRRWLCSLSCR